ncbi:MAG: hypothetical protein Q4P06_04835 [Actinomycetaceae bacterium]|nr:hypothetical protein [Actinomycetaceae bacterium]
MRTNKAGRHRQPASHKAKKPHGQWKMPIGALLVALMVAGGISAISYPTVANWVHQYNQSKLVRNYDAEVKTLLRPH